MEQTLVSPSPERHLIYTRLAALLLSLSWISSAQSLNFTEYPFPSSYLNYSLNYIVAGPDGALWFPFSASAIGRITTAGVITEYATPTPNSGLGAIAAGPDGAVWFVEAIGKIGRVTSSGAMVEYEIPTPLSGPQGIAAGPDGALWFTEGGGVGKVGRITTAGSITEYATPTANSAPQGITTGSDGAIWFVESQAFKIGRITVGGVITEFALPSVLVDNNYIITAGPDGALWFNGGAFGSTLGRITTTGIISFDDSQFSQPASEYDRLGGITAGPDGAIWFTQFTTSHGGVIWEIASIGGTLTRYYLPDSSHIPEAITLGPDGALWFTEASMIVRAALVYPTPTVADVRSAADEYLQTIQPNSWVTIYGSNLAPPLSGRTWDQQDIVNGMLPLSLDGVSVTIDGKPAYVEYISPTQVNVLAPEDAAIGPVNVIVTNGGTTGAAFSTQTAAYSPAFFTFPPPNDRYVAAILPSEPDGTASYLAPVGALGAGASSQPASAGDIVELYATGFGPVNPAPPGGQVFLGAYPTVAPVTVTIGGLDSVVLWAGVTSPGLVQLNVIVPAGLPAGDASVLATVGAVQSQGGTFIPVQH